MTMEKPPKGLFYYLTADQDFTKPDVGNDQVWELSTGNNSPRALSISTSYGLRAKRMLLFPRFALGDTFVLDPDEYHSFPVVEFSSTNFLTLSFKPYLSLDVLLRVWVPDSQAICGQICLTNSGEKTLSIGLDWLCLLTPFPDGTPMNPVQMGINKVLQGSTSGVFPVFYMTGGPEESDSPYPGLNVRIVLSPGITRNVTWVLASRDSTEASFARARHYSSKLLENEQLTVEMRDRRSFVEITTSDSLHQPKLRESQVQASRLIMPPVKKFTHPTYLTERSTETGNNPNLEILETASGWSGQKLLDTWLMMENLLPANPEAVQGFIENHLMTAIEGGEVDLVANCNLRRSGLLAPPILNWLTLELQPYQKDDEWLITVLPQLEAFLSHWVKIEGNGLDPLIKGWSHPAQLGIEVLLTPAEDDNPGYFPSLNSPEDILLQTLLTREIESYIELSRRGESSPNLEKYENVLKYLKAGITVKFQDALSSAIENSPKTTKITEAVIPLTHNGSTSMNRDLPLPATINIKFKVNQPLTNDFCGTLYGEGLTGRITEEFTTQSLVWMGATGFYTTRNTYTKLNSINLKGWPEVNQGWVQLGASQRDNIMQFLPLWSGVPSQVVVDALLKTQNLEQFFSPGGLTFRTSAKPGNAQRIPSFLAGMIIEGLLRYGKTSEATKVFEHHFLGSAAMEKAGSIEALIPIKLYLKLLGIQKLTLKELVLADFIKKSEPVTVQYNKIRLKLMQDHVDIDLGAEGHFTVNTPGPQRILLA